MRPLELGAHIVVHSVTKYLAGHGDVLGGVVVTDERASAKRCARLSRTLGPVLGPFEGYLTMRGIKTFAAAHGAAVRQRLPRGVLAGDPSRAWSASTSPATRRIPTPPPSAACSRKVSTARWSASK